MSLRGGLAAEAGTVTFCYNNWPPYTIETDGEAAGLSIGILREASARAGLKPRFVNLPWKRCLSAVESGEIDAVVDAAERPEFAHGDISFTYYTNTFWVRRDEETTAVDKATLAGRRLGLVAGYVYGDALERLFADSGVQIDLSVDDEMLVRKLAFGRTDIIVADFVSTHKYAAAKNLDLRPLQPAQSVDPLYPSFNRARHATMQALDDGLRSMCADGTVHRAYIAEIGYGPEEIFGETLCRTLNDVGQR
ncbi:MAG: transporter substrate-binding domain-containing protein [Alphaproteobacteria bacterium]